MSDSLRQSTSDKVGSALQPDSTKSTTERLGDQAKSAADSVGSALQPQSEKSTTQKATDALDTDNTNKSNKAQGESYLDQASAAVGSAVGQAQHALGLDQKK